MDANTIKVYEILKDYWGEDKASVVLDYLDNEATLKVKQTVEDRIGNLATKEDISELETATRENIMRLETATREDILRLGKDILELKTANREDIMKLEKDILELKITTQKDTLELKTSIADNHADIIKWMFIFWIGTTGTIIAIVKLL